MRLFRAGLSVLLLMLGQETLAPLDVVQFVQIRRRKLRALKYQGLKIIRTKQNDSKESKKGLLQRILSLPANMMCSPGSIEEPETIVIGKKQKSQVMSYFI